MRAHSDISNPRWPRTAIALLFACLPLLGSCAQRFGGGTGTVVEATTGQPMAGVHIVLYLMSSGSTGPFPSSSTICGPDYYTVSDEQGKFTIPDDALDLPWRFSLSPRIPSFNAVAYKPGYVGYDRVQGITYFNDEYKKTGPIKVDFEMKKDERTPDKRAQWLANLSLAGCQCWAFHKESADELREIAYVEGPADGQRAKRGEARLFPNGVPGPMRLCK
jgi:hypothetical protein